MDTNNTPITPMSEQDIAAALEEIYSSMHNEIRFTDAELDEYERIVNAKHGTPHEL